MAEFKQCPFCGWEIAIDTRKLSIESTVTSCHCTRCYMVFIYRQDFAYSRKARVAINDSFEEVWNNRAESEELKFTRQFIHEHGLEFALASAWNRRAEDA